MSNQFDYPTPTSPKPIAVVLSAEGDEVTISQRKSAGIDVEPPEDAQPQQQPKPGQPYREPSIPHSLPSQNPVDPHTSNWFQKMFEQFRDQHLFQTSAIFKAEEENLQHLLTRVRNIVGPRVAKWIDEDVAASMEAGKLARRDLFELDAEFKRSNNEDDLSNSKNGGSEEHDEPAINSDRKGKGKAKDNDGPSQNSSDKGRTGDTTKTSGSQTRSNRRKRSVESQSDESDENTDRQKRSKISPVVSSRSPPVPERPSHSPLKRVRQEVEDNVIGSEDEVEKSITIHRSFSSIIEDSSPVSKKARHQPNHIFDTADISNGSGTNSPRPQTRFSADNHAGPSTTTNHVFPPSAFPAVRPSPAPKRPHEPRAKPLQRDTRRVRANSATGAFEVFDYESTLDYRERLQREQYCDFLQPTILDTKADLQAMTELDGPRFKFDRDAWKKFEDHTLVSESD